MANTTVLVALAFRLKGDEGENNRQALNLRTDIKFNSRPSATGTVSYGMTVHQITVINQEESDVGTASATLDVTPGEEWKKDPEYSLGLFPPPARKET